jgi:murein L,D-transpeptidase YafK
MGTIAKIIAAGLFALVIAAILLTLRTPHPVEPPQAGIGPPTAPLLPPPTAPPPTASPPAQTPAPVPETPAPPPPKPLATLMSERGLRRGQPVFVRIFKESSELELHMRGDAGWVLVKTYAICRWSGALGPKLREGDGQAPEGFYMVTRRALNPNSSYHLSFNLGFPNAFDRAHGRTGSFLMVHGHCVSIGCYAMTNAGIEEIYGLVDAALRSGQGELPVHVFPFRMTVENLMRNRASPHAAFWANLKEGHDWFEATRRPPQVHVCGKAYAFSDGGAPAGQCQRIAGM